MCALAHTTHLSKHCGKLVVRGFPTETLQTRVKVTGMESQLKLDCRTGILDCNKGLEYGMAHDSSVPNRSYLECYMKASCGIEYL